VSTIIGNAGGGAAHAIVQPTIVCNYIIRII
jgi:microcystin-dependent protein